MNEYISKQSVLSKCDAMWNNADETTQTGVDTINTIDIIIDFIESLPPADVQPVRHMWWITKAEDYYKAWQDSGRSWDDMPYFVTGVKFACSNCFGQFDIDAKGVEKWNGCPLCLARLGGDME